MKLNQTIKKLRKERGFTQEQLAEQLGVSLMTVRRWEWGSTSPNSNMLLKLTEIFAVSLEDLLTENTDETGVMPQKEHYKKELPGLAYWGGVADNAKTVAQRGNSEDIADVTHILMRALASLGAKVNYAPQVTALGRETAQPVVMA